MEFGSDACAGLKGEQVHGLAAVAESEHKHASASVPAAVWIADHRAGAVVHMSLFAGRGDDGAAGRPGAAAQLADGALFVQVDKADVSKGGSFETNLEGLDVNACSVSKVSPNTDAK